MALKCLSQARSRRQKDELGGERGAIHNHKNIKQGRIDESEEKKASISPSPPSPTCSYCFTSPATCIRSGEMPSTACSPTLRGAGWAPGPHPPVTGLPSSTMHKKQRQKSVRREKTLSTSAEIDQSSLDLSKVLQKLLILQVTASLLKQETSRSSVKLSKWRWQLLYFWTVNGNRSGNSTPFWFFS